MEDNNKDILDRLSAAGDGAAVPPADDEPTPIPVEVTTPPDPRGTAEESLRQAETEARQGEEIVREYQRKYYGEESETSTRRQRAEELAGEFRSRVNEYQWRPTAEAMPGLSDEEKLWAALAHASALVTLGAGIATGGIAVLVLMFVPLAIYFSYREKSDFVAFHALQSFALQVIGTIGLVIFAVGGILALVVGIVVSAIASVVLIGIPFLLAFILLLVLFVGVIAVLPFAFLILSLFGTISTYTGRDFRYPFIASWLDRQSADGMDSF